MRYVARLLVVVAAAFVLVVGLAQVTPATGHGGDQRSEDCDGSHLGDDHTDGDHSGDGGGDCDGGASTTTAPTAPSGSTSTAPSSASVSIPGRSFSPASVTIAAGGTVRWSNSDGDSHTVTADNGSFDSGILASGRTWSHTFSAAGAFTYHCEVHPDMRGTVTVAGAGGATGSTASPAPPATKAAGSQPSAPSAAPAAGGSVDRPVSMIDLAFSPRSVSAVVGDSVTWTNRGSAVHTATADNGSFDSGMVKPGGKWRFALAKAGTFRYHCAVHPSMVGTITVAVAGSPAPPVAPAAKGGGTAGATGGVSGASSAARANVAIRDFEFAPPSVTVAKGTTVTWTNRGNAPHTATAADHAFDSGMLQPGGKFSHRFDSVGTFQYLCLVHPSMRGTVVVTKSAAPGAASAGDPAGGQGGTTGPGDGAATATTLGTEPAASRVNPTLVAALLVGVASSAGLLVTALTVVVATRKLLTSQAPGPRS
jgi:plastocyanin